MTNLLLKRSRIALNEVYDVVSEGRALARIALSNGPAPSWSWTLAYSFHEGRTPTRGHEPTRALLRGSRRDWHDLNGQAIPGAAQGLAGYARMPQPVPERPLCVSSRS
jgi:hypothetical protein